MADLRPQRRIEDGDREALEHIARALEGRVLFGPGATAPVPGATTASETHAGSHTHRTLPTISLPYSLSSPSLSL